MLIYLFQCIIIIAYSQSIYRFKRKNVIYHVIDIVYIYVGNIFIYRGVGLTAAERLLSLNNAEGIEICLVCRNKQRAEVARSSLLKSHPNATVDIVLIDTSSIASVIKGAKELRIK